MRGRCPAGRPAGGRGARAAPPRGARAEGSCGAAASARAAEEKEAGPGASGAVTEVFKWIHFAILAGGIGYVYLTWGRGAFAGRVERIGAAIKEATGAREAAERQLREAESRLANLEEEVSALRAAARREASAEGVRIRVATQKEAEKVAAAAQAEIEAAERAARVELKALAARLAVDGAEALLARQLTPKVQESLVKSFVESLAGRPN